MSTPPLSQGSAAGGVAPYNCLVGEALQPISKIQMKKGCIFWGCFFRFFLCFFSRFLAEVVLPGICTAPVLELRSPFAWYLQHFGVWISHCAPFILHMFYIFLIRSSMMSAAFWSLDHLTRLAFVTFWSLDLSWYLPQVDLRLV